ncbi:hypothetical protein EIN_409730 [Entamoeba invadens IP1]|uniref:Uncharacterized protein n=1 Tax=Entamoeba invadens IP1 TaxID=370355 RepID=A0A0A1TWP0_ENTIV|nr:hypothetical protein EIN_409730 [Entamoeba invadens IP1]ELP85654.1 hypothetical protein EIN_409730 [Entamoeba invadens IP1]|eukprot:XP_004185000.1 hypothetical protein EIN_409730 [Entamoeba invadens IP1]
MNWADSLLYPPLQSPIDLLLSKSECTLEELLECEDFPQEFQSNSSLVEFCKEPAIIKRILQYTMYDYPKDVDQSLSNKFHLVCVSIFAEPSQLSEVIGSTQELVDYVFAAIASENKTKMGAAGLVLSSVISSDNYLVYKRFTEDETIIKTIMENYDVPGFLDSIFQFMHLENDDKYSGVIEYICKFGFIKNILQTMMNSTDLDTITNISTFIHNIVVWKVSYTNSKAIKFLSLLNQNEFLQSFVEFAFVSKDYFVVEHILRDVSNILACSTFLVYPDQNNLPGIFKSVLTQINKFPDIFHLKNTSCVINNLLYVVLSLVLSGFDTIIDAIVASNTMKLLVELLYGDHMSTIVRQSVLMAISAVISSKVSKVLISLLDDGKFLKLLVEKDKESVAIQAEKNIGPDYWLVAASIMKNLYEMVPEEESDIGEVERIIIDDNEFMEYVKNIVIPRDEAQSEYFTTTDYGRDEDNYDEDSNEEVEEENDVNDDVNEDEQQ